MPINPALINAQGSASASVTIASPGDTLTGNYDVVRLTALSTTVRRYSQIW